MKVANRYGLATLARGPNRKHDLRADSRLTLAPPSVADAGGAVHRRMPQALTFLPDVTIIGLRMLYGTGGGLGEW